MPVDQIADRRFPGPINSHRIKPITGKKRISSTHKSFVPVVAWE